MPNRHPLRRADALSILATHEAELRAFGVRSPAIFGSVARDQARPDSGIGVLVEFEGPAGLFELARLQRYLADLLDRPVDIVTPDGLRRPIRDQILAEAIRAAERVAASAPGSSDCR